MCLAGYPGGPPGPRHHRRGPARGVQRIPPRRLHSAVDVCRIAPGTAGGSPPCATVRPSGDLAAVAGGRGSGGAGWSWRAGRRGGGGGGVPTAGWGGGVGWVVGLVALCFLTFNLANGPIDALSREIRRSAI